MIWLALGVIALLCLVAAWSERQSAPPSDDDLLQLFDEEEPH